MKKIIIAGGTGFIGDYLSHYFKSNGYEVFIISRQAPHIQWTDTAGIATALEGAECLINMAGKSVDCRYNAANKAEILRSRVATTKQLGEAIQACKNSPKLWMNSSTATIYRHEEECANTESTGIVGEGFSVSVAKAWEEKFFSFHLPQTRQVALRIAIVLGNAGGAFVPLKNLVKFGLGGQQGNGQQMFSWLHIADLKNMLVFIMQNEQLKGAVNCVSPHAIQNKTMMLALRKAMCMPFGLPTPKWLLQIGARFINTETELVLKSRWVYPETLLNNGFQFQYPAIESALENLIKE
jgi:uncharacterized protein (TIGR01777 family)